MVGDITGRALKLTKMSSHLIFCTAKERLIRWKCCPSTAVADYRNFRHTAFANALCNIINWVRFGHRNLVLGAVAFCKEVCTVSFLVKKGPSAKSWQLQGYVNFSADNLLQFAGTSDRGPTIAATFVAVYALFGPTFPGTYDTKRCIYTLFYPVGSTSYWECFVPHFVYLVLFRNWIVMGWISSLSCFVSCLGLGLGAIFVSLRQLFGILLL